MKILKTNWINIIGVLGAVFLYSVILNLTDSNTSQNIFQAVFAGLILILFYGVMFWVLFIVSLIIFDLLFIVKNQSNLKIKLLAEWFILSVPFIYWAIKYSEWIFLVAIISFLITQLRRRKMIEKVF
jgi:hypothetical protein